VAAKEGEVGARAREKPYRCFLVRCRLEGSGQPTWRFTVQQAGTGGARRSFTCFDDVAAHMQAELASCGALAAGETESEAATHGRPTSQEGVLQ
jgi:hypothetical protein